MPVLGQGGSLSDSTSRRTAHICSPRYGSGFIYLIKNQHFPGDFIVGNILSWVGDTSAT